MMRAPQSSMADGRLCRSTIAVSAGVREAPLRTSSISIRASAMSCNRRFGSLSRHRCSNRVTPGGVAAGSARQSGSRSRILAMVSETVSRGECRAARQHLVEHAAERPDVRPLVDRLPARLLRAHVGRRPENHPVTRAADAGSRRLCQIRAGGIAARRLRQAEVEDLDDAVGRDLDVGRFQIAVNDALLVRRFQRLGDLPRDRQRLARSGSVPARSARRGSSPSTSSRMSAGVPSMSSTP